MEVEEVTEERINELVELYIKEGFYNGKEKREVAEIVKKTTGKGGRGRPPLPDPTFDKMGIEVIILGSQESIGAFDNQEEFLEWATNRK